MVLRWQLHALIRGDLVAAALALIDTVVRWSFSRLPNFVKISVLVHTQLAAVFIPSHSISPGLNRPGFVGGPNS